MSFQRFIFASDLHGDMQEPSVVAKLIEFTAAFDPHVRIFGGDLFDFRPLRKGASAEERAESMRSDVDAGLRFLRAWKPHTYLRGNHCERLWELAETGNGVAADYAQKGVQDITAACARLKCQMLPYHKRDGILKLGHLKMLHGFYCGVTAARQHAWTYGACIFGHVHTIDEASVPGLERRCARAVGALCNLNMPYNARSPNTLRQAHGWAYGVVNTKTGNFWIQQAEEVDGVWMLPSEFKQL
jgi:hypothetical protein